MEEAQAAAEAATKVAKSVPLSTAITLASDAGVGFLGLAISGIGLSIAVQSAKHALRVAKG